MTREEALHLLKRLSGGCCESVLDGILYSCFLFGAGIGQPRTSRGLHRAGRIADTLFDQCNAETVRTWVKRLRAKGWISAQLRVTAEGQRRLMGLLPAIAWHRQWAGQWHLVSFDVPERQRARRNALRFSLRRLHFGKLHASVWISPWNFFGDVQEIVRQHHLNRMVIMAMSSKLGTQESKDLAGRIWQLADINDRYREFVRRSSQKSHARFLLGDFLAILREDPQLPKALLPRPWYGFDALRIARHSSGAVFDQLVQK